MRSSGKAPFLFFAGGLTPVRATLLVALLWAGVYLPGLGTLQLQHEEPRRALPGIHMLASGDWLVPRVGSEPYVSRLC